MVQIVPYLIRKYTVIIMDFGYLKIRFRQYMTETDYAPNTIRCYLWQLDQLKDNFASISYTQTFDLAKALDPLSFRKSLKALHNKLNIKNKYIKSCNKVFATLNQYISAWHLFARFCYKVLNLDDSGFQKQKSFKIHQRSAPIVNLKSYIEHSKQEVTDKFSLRDICLFECIAVSGLRLNEALNLKVEDVDLENACLFVHSNRYTRQVFLDKVSCNLLINLTKTNKTNSEQSYLFCSRQGERMSCNKARMVTKAVSKHYAGMELTPNILRQICAVHYAVSTTDFLFLKAFLGYSSIKSTFRYGLMGFDLSYAIKIIENLSRHRSRAGSVVNSQIV